MDESEIVSQAMRILRARNTPAQQAASRTNGTKGGRPRGLTPLEDIPCNCGGIALDHRSTCPRGRAIRRRELPKGIE